MAAQSVEMCSRGESARLPGKRETDVLGEPPKHNEEMGSPSGKQCFPGHPDSRGARGQCVASGHQLDDAGATSLSHLWDELRFQADTFHTQAPGGWTRSMKNALGRVQKPKPLSHSSPSHAELRYHGGPFTLKT